jgi:guanylate kinase
MGKTNRNIQSRFDQHRSPLVFVLSGPSGVGKDTVLNRLKKARGDLQYVTTVTTRPRRPKEQDGIDYSFVSAEKFHDLLQQKELLEWACVYGNWYGVPKKSVRLALEEGRDSIIKVDIQGAANIKKAIPQAILIFLMPPSMEELTHRLQKRHTETRFDLKLRTKTAVEEMNKLPEFDYKVVNNQDKVDNAVADIEAIIKSVRQRGEQTCL